MKFLLLGIATLFTISTFGQIEKGTYLIGGNMFLKSKKGNFELTFNPNIGYFVNNSICIGIFSDINFYKYEIDDIHSTQYSIGPQIRYYITTGNISLFTEFKTSYGILSTKYLDDYNNTSKTSGNIFNIKPGLGLAYFIANNVAIETLFSYYWTKSTYHLSNSSFNEDFKYNDNGFNFLFGLQIYLKSKNN